MHKIDISYINILIFVSAVVFLLPFQAVYAQSMSITLVNEMNEQNSPPAVTDQITGPSGIDPPVSSVFFKSHGMHIKVSTTEYPPPSSIQVLVKSLYGSTLDVRDSITLTFENIPGTSMYDLPTTYVYFDDDTDLGMPTIAAYPEDIIAVSALSDPSSQVNTKVISNEMWNLPQLPPQPVYDLPQCQIKDPDGLCREWKQGDGLHVSYGDSPSEFVWYCNQYDKLNACPTPGGKDIYVELDYLAGHKPDRSALESVVDSFANHGITLHIDIDDQIPQHKLEVTAPSEGSGVTDLSVGDTNFDQLKRRYFGTSDERQGNPDISDTLTAKHMAVHYGIFAHNLPSGESGKAEIGGNDFLVTLGNWAGGVGTPDDQAGTFMHELGHNLYLFHGGNDDVNCKPNYPSVMNYALQFSTFVNRPLDYSSEALINHYNIFGMLDENSLNEFVGVSSVSNTSPFPVVYSDNGVLKSASTGYWAGPPLATWLPFEEHLDDISGNGNSATGPSDLTYFSDVYDRPGKSYVFADNHLTIPYEQNLEFGMDDSFTVSFWAREADTSSDYVFYVSAKNGLGSNDPGWLVWRWQDYTLFRLEGSSDTGYVEAVIGPSQVDMRDGQWHHVTATYDGTTKTATLHIDDKSDSVTIPSYIADFGNTNSLSVGSSPWSGYQFKGELDDVRIWKSKFNDSEVTRIQFPNQSWLPFEEHLDDISGNGNSATGPSDLTYFSDVYDRPGKSYVFADNHLTIPYEQNLEFGMDDSFTVSFWAREADTSSDYVFYVSAKNGLGSNDPGWLVWRWQDYTLFRLEGSSDTGYVEAVIGPSQVDMRDGQWHHVTATYDGTTKTATLYIDDKSDSVTIPSYIADFGNTNSLSVGSSPWSEYQFKGELDDVRIWKSKFNDSEANALYSQFHISGFQVTQPIAWADSSILQNSVSADVNYIAQLSCPGDENQLMGHNDWENIVLDMSLFGSATMGDGLKTP